MDTQTEDRKSDRILILDDHPANTKLLARILELSGHKNIHSITDPRKFFDTYFELRPDLVLLDLKMPYMDGFTILEKLKETDEDGCLPVIVISAQNEQENRLKALRLGVHDFIGKPFDQAEVVTRVQNFLCIRSVHQKIKSYNRLLEEKVLEKTNEKNSLEMELIERLLRTAEFRDHNTGNHIERVSHYAKILAKAMGLPDEEASKISLACKMHDIGKIAIPDEILLKRPADGPGMGKNESPCTEGRGHPEEKFFRDSDAG